MKFLAILLVSSAPALAGIQTGGNITSIASEYGLDITAELMERHLFEAEKTKIFSSTVEIKALQDFQTNDGQRGLIMLNDKGEWRLLLEKLED